MRTKQLKYELTGNLSAYDNSALLEEFGLCLTVYAVGLFSLQIETHVQKQVCVSILDVRFVELILFFHIWKDLK